MNHVMKFYKIVITVIVHHNLKGEKKLLHHNYIGSGLFETSIRPNPYKKGLEDWAQSLVRAHLQSQ